MAIRTREHVINTDKPAPDLQSPFKMIEDCMKYIFIVKHGSSDAIGISLFLYSINKQQIIWRDYVMSDPQNDLHDVECKINLLIQDPKSDYFVVASGDIKQAYDDGELKLHQAGNSRGILSIVGKGPQGHTVNEIIIHFGKCDSCDKPLQLPYYLYYHDLKTGEYYKSSSVTSEDERERYDFLGECKKRADGIFVRSPYMDKERLCSKCYGQNETEICAIRLHLLPDSIDPHIEHYISTLPEPAKIWEQNGYYHLGRHDQETVDDTFASIEEDLHLAFAEDDTNFYLQSRQHQLEDLRNNFIRDKTRRWPNNEELTAWMKRHSVDRFLEISRCEIFDMRGSYYVVDDVIRRFIVIVHFLVPEGFWVVFHYPPKSSISFPPHNL
jgi:hypothetical protein